MNDESESRILSYRVSKTMTKILQHHGSHREDDGAIDWFLCYLCYVATIVDTEKVLREADGSVKPVVVRPHADGKVFAAGCASKTDSESL